MTLLRFASLSAVAWVLAAPILAQAPLGTAFTYQGQLKENQLPAGGTYDLRFRLFDAAVLGSQVGLPDCADGVAPQDGLFTVELDFGLAVFDGSARWMEIAVRADATAANCVSPAGYVVLAPRQPLTAAPYALYALSGPASGSLWQAAGNNITNANTGFVGINRSAAVTGPEYFGIQAPVASGYGGMYIRTDGTAGLPFYGYRAGVSGETAWSYLDGPSGDWRLNVDGDRVTVTDAGDVGIGTTSPLARLSVETPTISSANNTARFYAPNLGPNTSHIHYGTNGDWYIRSADDAGKVVLQDTGGNVGVGTATPSAKLQVMAENDGNASTPAFAVSGQSFDPQGYGGSFAGSGFLGSGKALIAWGDSELLGTVGVGTNVVPTGVKMAVNGKILCEEIEVQLYEDWPDYVFAADYLLMPLEQVDAYVREHKHLPDVPSAAEIKSDGVNVGEMHATLLRKVEELTLHLIALDREVNELRAVNETLRRGSSENPVSGGQIGPAMEGGR